MAFDAFRQEIEAYLPIDFYNEENNTYKRYLLDALTENWANGKYQFCIVAANILFMCLIYKDFYFFKINHETISYDNSMKADIFNNASSMFDLSEYEEKKAIYACMKTLQIHVNDIEDAKELITKRNHCAHASGKVHYCQTHAERFFEDIICNIEKIEKKREKKIWKCVSDDFAFFLTQSQNIKEFVKNILEKYSLSKQECLELYFRAAQFKGALCEDNCYYALLKYHMGKLSEDIANDNIDDVLIADIKGLIIKFSDNIESIRTIFETDLEYECQQTWDTIPFNRIKSIFNNSDKIDVELNQNLNEAIKDIVDLSTASKISPLNQGTVILSEFKKEEK